MTQKRKDILVNLIVGLVVALAVTLLNPQMVDNLIQRICDGCFVAAVLLLGFGGLMFARNQGTFDMMTYSMASVFRLHMPAASIGHARDEDFATYKERKAQKRKSPAGSLIAGAVYLALSVILLVIYYMV